ncbi:membrane-associated protein, putative [Bodo saltans]|uniref:Membrane-associated protein, putative n=1 Tax=Bodo saltans TaxID=75058 RepID=A0A0S4KJC2_BODSA|nr:membrane-associated protein, putative [Bodo saltans]|eukprot:CUI14628.1 membrane-associated protein, putative [Bodo saltans]
MIRQTFSTWLSRNEPFAAACLLILCAALQTSATHTHAHTRTESRQVVPYVQHTKSTHTRTMSCPLDRPPRNLTCPIPQLSNITLYDEPMVNGSYQINKYNKSWDINWYAEYNQSIDGVGECGNVTNPLNYFSRECNWTLACNIPNVTNGSVTFHNFTVDLSTPFFSALNSVYMNLTFYVQHNVTQDFVLYYSMVVPITQIKVAGQIHNYVFPSLLKGTVPGIPLGQAYFLTSNWTERAKISARFYTDNTSDATAQRALKDMGIFLNMHFECDSILYNVTVYTDPDIGLILALALPFGLIALIMLAAFLKYKFPNMCDCCKRNNDGSDNFDDDEAILAAARAKREGRDLAQPMVDIKDRAGMQTWLDQAEDVVEDLNKNCLYLEEAKADSQMNKGFDALERAGDNPTLGSHSAGFIGGRQLYAAGAASGGVKVIDHRPTMQTKGGGDDDVVL